MTDAETSQEPTTRVLYNGDCPVCRFEITHYADYARAQDLPLSFEDLNEGAATDWGMTRDDAARRLYVMKDGEKLGGIDGFIVLWREMPRYAWLARVIGSPVLRPLAVAVYDYFLAPAIYRWDRVRRKRRGEIRP